jgi:general secretion pathway protein D
MAVSRIIRLALAASLLIAAVFAQRPAGRPSGNDPGDPPKEEAMLLARKGGRAEKAGHYAEAYLFWSEAAALQPRNRKYRARMGATQSRAALAAQATPSDAALAEAGSSTEEPTSGAPESVYDSLTARDFALARQLLAPPVLRGKDGTFDFDLNGNPRELFAQVAQRFGIEPVFDGEYPPAGAPIRFRVTAVDYRQALRDLEAATDSFVIPISSAVFMVARDTTQKRNDLEQSVAVSVAVPDALTAQELTEIAQIVRQATGIEKLALDNARNAIVMRDRISRMLPARALLEQLMSRRPQVMLEVELLEVTDSDIVNYGFSPSTSLSAVFLGNVLNNAQTVPAGVANLVTFGAGKTLIGLTVATAQASFTQSTSHANSLYHAEIRSIDGQAATLHIGDKYPVVTSGYYGAIPAGQQGNVYQPPPSYTFEDLGLSVKVTPHSHMDGEITLNVETTFELLKGSASNGIPLIGRRALNTQVRLREGEWAVVAGIMSSTDSKSTSSVAGLSSLPLIGNLFKQTTKDTERDNVLIAIRPHEITLGPELLVPKPLRVGTETRPMTPLL